MLELSARSFWDTHGTLVNRMRIMAKVAVIKRPCYSFIDACRKKVIEMACPFTEAVGAWRMANVLCSLLNCGTSGGGCRFHVVWACDVGHRAFKCRVSEEKHSKRVECYVFSGATQFPSFHACYNSLDNALMVSGSTPEPPLTHSTSCFYIVDVRERRSMDLAKRVLLDSVCPAQSAGCVPRRATHVPYHWTYCMPGDSSYCGNMTRMASAFCGTAVDERAVETAVEAVLLEQGCVPDPHHDKADVFAALVNLWGQCAERSFNNSVVERAVRGHIIERLYVTNEAQNGEAHLFLRNGMKADEWMHVRESAPTQRVSTAHVLTQLNAMKLPVFVHDGGVTFFLCKIMQRACTDLKYAHRGAVLRKLFMATQHLLFGPQESGSRPTLLQRNHEIGHASRFIFSLVMAALRMYGVEKDLTSAEERDFSQIIMKQLFGEVDEKGGMEVKKPAAPPQLAVLLSCH